MPAQSNQTAPAAGTVFNDGILTITLPGGAGIVIGLCQDFSINYANKYVEMPGPGSPYSAAEAVTKKTVTLTIKTGVVDLRPLMAAMGAAVVFATPITTLTEALGDIPPVFALSWKTPSDGTDIAWTATRVLMDDFKMTGTLHTFNEGDWTAHCLPDATTGKVFTMAVTGNQTSS